MRKAAAGFISFLFFWLSFALADDIDQRYREFLYKDGSQVRYVVLKTTKRAVRGRSGPGITNSPPVCGAGFNSGVRGTVIGESNRGRLVVINESDWKRRCGDAEGAYGLPRTVWIGHSAEKGWDFMRPARSGEKGFSSSVEILESGIKLPRIWFESEVEMGGFVQPREGYGDIVRMSASGVNGRGALTSSGRWGDRERVCTNLNSRMIGRIVLDGAKKPRQEGCGVLIEFDQAQWDTYCPMSKGKKPQAWIYNCHKGRSRFLTEKKTRFFERLTPEEVRGLDLTFADASTDHPDNVPGLDEALVPEAGSPPEVTTGSTSVVDGEKSTFPRPPKKPDHLRGAEGAVTDVTPSKVSTVTQDYEAKASEGEDYANSCVVNPKGPKVIRDQFLNPDSLAHNDFMKAFLEETQGKLEAECEQCSVDRTAQDNVSDLRSVARAAGRPTKIKRTCVKAALQRIVWAQNKYCSDDTGKPRRRDMRDPCVTDQMIDYITWGVNKALACFSTKDKPMDPRIAFQKLNTESGLQYWIRVSGGIGAGQLTTPAVDDMYDPARGWSKVIQPALNSGRAECEPFKKVMDLPHQCTRTAAPGKCGEAGGSTRWCQMMSSGEGLGRNLFLSLGYFKFVRDSYPNHNARQLLSRRGLKDDSSENYRKILDYLTFVGYSASGPAGMESMFAGIKLNKNTRFEDFVKDLRDAHYVDNIEDRMEEVLQIREKDRLREQNPSLSEVELDKIVKDMEFTDSDLQGEPCVE
jgi:hypothetical protein